ncbi:MAG: hypothetical protein CM15mP32_4490 [Flavobacteriaceae bacterium]|nr:MAG: hypothetical protein CM15mP32_4490 [Flavobacteriaceae bacterium]
MFNTPGMDSGMTSSDSKPTYFFDTLISLIVTFDFIVSNFI